MLFQCLSKHQAQMLFEYLSKHQAQMLFQCLSKHQAQMLFEYLSKHQAQMLFWCLLEPQMVFECLSCPPKHQAQMLFEYLSCLPKHQAQMLFQYLSESQAQMLFCPNVLATGQTPLAISLIFQLLVEMPYWQLSKSPLDYDSILSIFPVP